MKKFFTILLSFVIIIAGFGVVIAFDSVKANFNQTEVLVASKDISFKEEITMEHLTTAEVPTSQVLEVALKPEHAEQILGSYAAIEIKKGQQLHGTLLDSFDLVPDESKGEFIAAIPESWLFVVPQSLRRSYLADFYVVATDEARIIESMSSGQQESFLKNDREPILQNVRISSVKNSSNAEVETVVSEDNRESTTGTISNMEIIANDDILHALRSSSENGYALYVVYTLQRAGNEDKEVIINESIISTPAIQEVEEDNDTEADENTEASEDEETEEEDNTELDNESEE